MECRHGNRDGTLPYRNDSESMLDRNRQAREFRAKFRHNSNQLGLHHGFVGFVI